MASSRNYVSPWVIHALLCMGVIFMLFPFAWMILTSLKSEDEVLDTSILIPRLKYFVEYVDPLGEKRLVRVTPTGRRRSAGRGREEVEVRYKSGAREFVPADRLVIRRWMWENYVEAWRRIEPSFSVYFFNSGVVALATTVAMLFTSMLAAYAFATFEFPLKSWLFTVLLATMMVPQQVLLVPDFLVLKHAGWYDTYMALVVPWSAGVFGIFMLRQFFLSLPRELYDAARIDGCTRWQYLVKILLPLSWPSMITLGVFTFLGSWNALLWPLIVTESADMRTVQVALNIYNQAESTNWELLMAASTFTTLPLVAAYFMLQRYFIQGVARSGLKG